MRKIGISLAMLCLLVASCIAPGSGSGDYPKKDQNDFKGPVIKNVSFQNVAITDNFWRPRIEINSMAGIRHALQQASQSIENFDIASGKSGKEYKANMASDSDVYKIIQGAAYALHHTPDKELETTVDSVIDRIVAAQQPDGYLNTYISIHDLSKRWTDLRKSHELYCAGHLIEAAVAYYQVTGKRKLLDAAIRFADYIDSVFGPGKRLDVPGHEEIELALYKLFQVTNEKKYFNLSAFFVDERGDPKRMKVDKITPPDHDPDAGTPNRWRPPSYMQDHLPVTQQLYAVGHAVRAMYLYSAMADIAIETGDTQYIHALDSIWNDIVRKKLYITGGIGTRQFHDEGFGSDYLLPNDQAYCETCSSIGLTFWNRRMCLLHGDAKYADQLELTMYNAAISGVSLSGDRFFYTNPLESKGKTMRNPWDNPPCCPTNIVRFLPEIGSNIYGKTDDGIYVNQFIGNEAKIAMGDQEISLKMETDYPWDGRISLRIATEKPADLTLHIRIPGWAQGEFLPGGLYHYLRNEKIPEEVAIKVNGERTRKIQLQKGYAIISRKWKPGDIVELDLPMNIRMVTANPKIQDDLGKVALMRGPLVYCLEEVDNKDYFAETDTVFLRSQSLNAEFRKDILNGVALIHGKATLGKSNREIAITAVPYYAWCNREQGQMKVWLPFHVNN
jgi:hypothetical protein